MVKNIDRFPKPETMSSDVLSFVHIPKILSLLSLSTKEAHRLITAALDSRENTFVYIAYKDGFLSLYSSIVKIQNSNLNKKKKINLILRTNDSDKSLGTIYTYFLNV